VSISIIDRSGRGHESPPFQEPPRWTRRLVHSGPSRRSCTCHCSVMFARAFLWSVVLLLMAAPAAPRGARAQTLDVEPPKTPLHRAAVESPPRSNVRPAGSAGTPLVLLGLLLGGAILARRLVQQRAAARSGKMHHNPVRLVSRQQIDPELNVRLLQVGPRLLVVAATPQGVATLSEITDPEEIALLTGETAATGAFSASMPISPGSGTPARQRTDPGSAGD